ncbi:Transcriptional regulator containing HTH domain [Methanonatronarchaeum thermophilum]|uniref:Transcriptional regulator containing HTH domain n=1 Tax=Methanonatronarchaeum thermophilum TaxID=1927129 RepID=A0A1Y3GAG9_9EURY|nr:winged helix-turn-helix domain-containing protein [Methanonatronarchaeum thermophilum]OUJ18442.1 Transcriptional regulator containing HTH domain [Methanonatronarchaeum thermophilum]
MRKRSEWEIYLCILESLNQNQPIKKTTIMHNVNMSWKPFNNHFGYLTENQFIQEKNNEYYITGEGKNLLKNLRQITKTFKKTIT